MDSDDLMTYSECEGTINLQDRCIRITTGEHKPFYSVVNFTALDLKMEVIFGTIPGKTK